MKRFVVLFLFILFVNCNYAQNTKLDSLLANAIIENNVLGMSVAVIKNNNLIYSKGFGIRDVERNLPVNNNTLFRIASISKMITTTALMTLYDKGLFKLDDDISQYLGFVLRNPNFPNDTITFRKILSHTSTIIDGSKYDEFLSATQSDNPPTLRDLFLPDGKYYTADMWLTKSTKDNFFEYANINFGIIGTIIEKLTGQRFDIVVRQNVLKPLGINGSFNVQDIINIDDLAVLYRKPDSIWVAQTDAFYGVKPTPRNLSNYIIGTNGVIFSPTGGLRVTCEELAKFMQMQLHDGILDNVRIISKKAAEIMQQCIWNYNGSNGITMNGEFKSYAFANHTTKDLLPGETLIGHPGEAYGLVSDMYFSKEKNYGIVFICNGGTFNNGAYSGWYKLEEDVFKAVYTAFDGFNK
ncbi:MAG: serine hydrolase domain-containing protein [bacterium]